MAPKFLTTGQAAKLCSVTPDTVLKWIRSGRLRARRTVGGHHRIEHHDVERLLQSAQRPEPAAEPSLGGRHHRYCWEYKGAGKLLDGCQSCVVYELRAQRCYEVVKVAPDLGHSKLFCAGSCEDCDYYQRVHEQGTNVLVVTDNPRLVESLRRDADISPFNVEFTDCEYGCSTLVETFRPDYAVLDCSLGPQSTWAMCSHLSQDPRIPFVRLILAGSEEEFPEDCEHLVFARIEKPFTMRQLTECTTGVPHGVTDES